MTLSSPALSLHFTQQPSLSFCSRSLSFSGMDFIFICLFAVSFLSVFLLWISTLFAFYCLFSDAFEVYFSCVFASFGCWENGEKIIIYVIELVIGLIQEGPRVVR